MYNHGYYNQCSPTSSLAWVIGRESRPQYPPMIRIFLIPEMNWFGCERFHISADLIVIWLFALVSWSNAQRVCWNTVFSLMSINTGSLSSQVTPCLVEIMFTCKHVFSSSLSAECTYWFCHQAANVEPNVSTIIHIALQAFCTALNGVQTLARTLNCSTESWIYDFRTLWSKAFTELIILALL